MSQSAIFSHDPVSEEETMIGPVIDEMSIGKSPRSDIILDDLRCNGIHALLERAEDSDDEYILTDLGSQYGTFVNGKRITYDRVRKGDFIIIGTKFLVIREHGEMLPPFVRNDDPSNPELRKPKTRGRGISLLSESELLQVSLYWGEQLLDVRTFTSGQPITLGAQRAATFGVTLSDAELQQKKPFKLAYYRRGQLVLNLPREATGLVWQGNETISLDTIRHQGKNASLFERLKLKLRVGDRAEIHFGELTLSFRFVKPAGKVSWKPPTDFDRNLRKIFAFICIFYALLFLFLTFGTSQEKEKTIQDVPKHLRRILFNAGIQNALKRQQSAIGKLAALQGGRARSEQGEASAKKAPEKAKRKAQKKSKPKKSKQVQAKNTKQTAKKEVAKQVTLDLDSAFSTTERSDITEPTRLVGKKSKGNTAAALVDGGYARGRTGEGAGGGGKSVGIGQLSGYDTGGGLGTGDYGINPSKGREIKIRDTEEIVILGGLDPDVIAAIIRRYLPQIQYCYEQRLTVKPSLKGKVGVSFIITGNGSVGKAQVVTSSLNDAPTENCMIKKILTWKFPEPRGGGTVGVKYPFILMSNSGR